MSYARILSGPLFHHPPTRLVGWWWWSVSLQRARWLEEHLWPILAARSILHMPHRAAD